MGTRSIIMVVGNTDEFGEPNQYKGAIRLYKHCDGDPTGNLRIIADAIGRMEALVEQSFEWRKDKVRRYGVEPMAYAIVVEAMSCSRLGACIEETFQGAPKLAHLGEQSDLEWVYVVDCNKRLVNVYSTKQPTDSRPAGEYSGEPREHLEAGLFDSWEVYVQEHREEYREEIRRSVEEVRQLVAATGWTLCGEADPYLRLVERANRKKAKAAAVPASAPEAPAAPCPLPVGELPVVSAFCI